MKCCRRAHKHRLAFKIPLAVFIASFLVSALFQSKPALAAACPTSGDFVTISTSCNFPAGTYTFTGDLTIAAGVTVTLNGNTTTNTGVTITADNIYVFGTITADGQGYQPNTGPGAPSGHGGASHGGNGGAGNDGSPGVTYDSPTQPVNLGSGASCGVTLNGGGAIKLVTSSTGTLLVSGTVTAVGLDADGCNAGASAGGSVWLDTGTFTGGGTVKVQGGAGPGGWNGGGGGGGRIAIYYSTYSATGTVQAYGGNPGYQVQTGGAGTIYKFQRGVSTNGDLIIDGGNATNNGYTTQTNSPAASQTYDNVTIRNGGDYKIASGQTLTVPLANLTTGGTQRPSLTINSGGTFDPATSTAAISSIDVSNSGTVATVTQLTISNSNWTHAGSFSSVLTNLTAGSSSNFTFSTSSTLSLSTLTVQNTGTVTQSYLGQFNVSTVTVQSGGTITHSANPSGGTKNYELNISADTIDVQTGGSIAADGKGYYPGYGGGTATGHGGAGHGGNGGSGSDGSPGGTYDSVTQPADYGSGASCGSLSGGGAIKLTAAVSLNVSGTISANGADADGCNSGASAGGSVWLQTATLTGAGTVRANGGAGPGGWNGGGGGGGRVAVYYTSDSSSLVSGNKINAYGGVQGYQVQWGGAGTVYLFGPGATNGNLIVDNNNYSSNGYTTQASLPTAAQSYDNVTIRNGADYRIPTGKSLTVPSIGNLAGGGSQRPSMTIDSGGTFDPTSATATFSGLDVVNNGTLSNVSTLSLTNSTLTQNGSFPATLTSVTAGSSGNFVLSTTNTVSLATLLVQNTGTFTQNMLGQVSVGTVTVQNGGTLTHSANPSSNTKTYELSLSSTSFDLQPGGTINVDKKGYPAGYGAGKSSSYGGASYGGVGGTGAGGGPGSAYGSITAPTDLGSSADACSFAGAGAVRLTVSGTLNLAGSISATGGDANGCQKGGASGGSVWLQAGTLTGGGTIDADGGPGPGGWQGGGGGGGRIAIYYTTNSATPTSITALGGNAGCCGAVQGGPGTIYYKGAAQTYGDLIVDNANRTSTGATNQTAATSETFDNITVRNGGKYVIPTGSTLTLNTGGTVTGGGSQMPSLTISSGAAFYFPASTSFSNLNIINNGTVSSVANLNVTGWTFTHNGTFTTPPATLTIGSSGNFIASTSSSLSSTDVTVQNGGTFTQNTAQSIALNSLTVQNGGTVTHTANSNSRSYVVDIYASDINIQAGGTVNANYRGYAYNQGTGLGTLDSGSSYGGNGGQSWNGAPGVTYGSVTQPNDIGSGGLYNCGSSGGGAIKLVTSSTGTITVRGTISANAQNPSSCGSPGPSGGSIWLDTGTLTGGGAISAIGGGNVSGGNYGGGGGGRVAIYYVTNSATGSVSVYGGTHTGSGQDGGSGTIYMKSSVATNGDLIVDNNNLTYNGYTTQYSLPSSSQTYDNVTIRNGADYRIPTGKTLAISSIANLTTSGSQRPSLTVDAGGTFTPNSSTATFNNLDVINNGTISNVSNLTLTSSTYTHNGSLSALLTSLTVGSSGNFIASTSSTFSNPTVIVQNGGTFTQNTTQTMTMGSLTVQSGGTVTHTANSNSRSYVVDIYASNINIQAGGTVSANYSGYAYNQGTGLGTLDSGSSYGGSGGQSWNGAPGATYGSVTQPTDIGSGGLYNCGSSGGGAIKLVTPSVGTITIGGTISANGQNPSSCGSGGPAGGSIWLDTGTLVGGGAISAIGGGYTSGGNYGGGGGGRIALYYVTNSATGTVSAYGGPHVGSGQDGGAGTIYMKSSVATNGNLIVDNNNLTYNGYTTQTSLPSASQTFDNVTIRNGADYRIPTGKTLSIPSIANLIYSGAQRPSMTVDSGGTFDPNTSNVTLNGFDLVNNGTVNDITGLTLTNSTYTHNGSLSAQLTSLTIGSSGTFVASTSSTLSTPTVIVQNGGTFTQNTTQTLPLGNVTVQSGGNINHAANAASRSYVVDFSANNLDVQAGGTINVDYRGYGNRSGTGYAYGNSGASHGGLGGQVRTDTVRPTYDSQTAPVDLGSGGYYCTLSGGGAVKIAIASGGLLTVNGTISANGQAAVACGAGGASGGSVYITAGRFTGGGTIRANGAAGVGGDYGGAGGGRIAIYYTDYSATGTVQALGGAGSGQPAGAAGTVYLSNTNQAPVITDLAHSPASPVSTATVTISATSTDDVGVTKIEIYMDGTAPAQLLRTCNFGTPTSPAACSFDAGPLTSATHTATVIAYDAVTNSTLSDSFLVSNPVPSISSLSPSYANTNAPDFTLTVNGSNFVSGSSVQWNSSARVTTYFSSSLLTAQILSSDVSSSTDVPITVVNPSPGGGTSTAIIFSVTPATPSGGVSIVTPLGSPLAGQGVALGSDSIRWSFTKGSGNATGFEIVDMGNGLAVVATTRPVVTSNATYLDETGLTPDTSYCNRAVEAFNENGSSSIGASQIFACAKTSAPAGSAVAITALTPSTAAVGSASLTLQVAGTGFTSGSVVKFNGQALATSFDSLDPGLLKADLTAEQLSASGTAEVYVSDVAGNSNSLDFRLVNPPRIAAFSVSPAAPEPGDSVELYAQAADESITRISFLVDGAAAGNGGCDFAGGLSTAECKVTVDRPAAGKHAVVMRAEDAWKIATESKYSFIVGSPVPAATSLSPIAAAVGTDGTALRVSGSGFVTSSVVRWNGRDLATVWNPLSPRTLRASVPASDLSATATVSVTVFTPAPGGGESKPLIFRVVNPPSVTSISHEPPTPSIDETISFKTEAVDEVGVSRIAVYLDGRIIKTCAILPPAISAECAGTDVIPGPGAHVLKSVAASVWGATATASENFSGVNPVPSILSIRPIIAAAGTKGLKLTVTGSNFVSGSVVRWNGLDRPTVYNARLKNVLTATLSESDLSAAGSFVVTVFNPEPGGGLSNETVFNVVNPPRITVIMHSPEKPGRADKVVLSATSTSDTGVVRMTISLDNKLLKTCSFLPPALSAACSVVTAPLKDGAHTTVVKAFDSNGLSGTDSETFSGVNLIPRLRSIDPSTIAAGRPMTLAVSGANFAGDSVVRLNGKDLPTSIDASNKNLLKAQVSAADAVSAGTATVTVYNPPPGGGESQPLILVIANPPEVRSISRSPETPEFNGPIALTASVSAEQGVAKITVAFDGKAAETCSFKKEAPKTAECIGKVDQVAPGRHAVTVEVIDALGVAGAGSLEFVGTNPKPSVSSLSQLASPVGSSGLDLGVTGADFIEGSVVRWNGSDRPTVRDSKDPNLLTARISADDLASAGNAEVAVFNPEPGGGISDSLTFSVVSPPKAVSFDHSPVSPAPSEMVTLTASAADDSGLSSIQILADGAVLKTCDFKPSETKATCETQVQAGEPGTYKVQAVATDVWGLTATGDGSYDVSPSNVIGLMSGLRNLAPPAPSFVYDFTPPAEGQPTTAGPELQSQPVEAAPGSTSSGSIATPTLTGEAPSGRQVIIYVDNQPAAIIWVTNDKYVYTLTKALKPGKHVVDVQVVPLAVSYSAPAAQVALPVAAVSVAAAAGPATLNLPLLLFTQPFLLFRRRRKRSYGVVYDSLRKLPVDQAIVRLYDRKTGRLVHSKVTDREGRYNFFVMPGDYRLEVIKKGYGFPTDYLRGKGEDGTFSDLQTGAELSFGTEELTSMNIPIDPSEDVRTPPQIRLRSVLLGLRNGVSLVGPAVGIYASILTPSVAMLSMTAAQVALYAAFRAVARRPRKLKGFGTVRDAQTGKPIRNAIVRVFDATYNKVLETQMTDSKGRYAFLVGRSNYYVTAVRPGYRQFKTESLDYSQIEKEAVVAKDISLSGEAGGAEVAPPPPAVQPPPPRIPPQAPPFQPPEPPSTQTAPPPAEPQIPTSAEAPKSPA